MTSPASLTKIEAEERAALLDVRRYDISVDLTGLLEGPTLRSESAIEFTCASPGATTFVDCVATVESAILNGVELDPATVERGRLPLTDLRTDNVLVVRASTDDTARADGILRTVDSSDKLVYLWTSFEPDAARNAWACFDQPDLKAPHRFTVTAPEEWTVTSNCAPESVTEPGEPTDRRSSPVEIPARVWSFPDTPPLSTYVVVVNAGPFFELRSHRDGYDLGLFCRQSLRPYLERDAEEMFELTSAGLAWYGERFAQPFPQARYDHVFVPNIGGAMENWGCVTCTDSVLFRSPPSYTERARRASLLMHEMAHMWFGDLVTMRWWDDLWLNEAFASWASEWTLAGATEFGDIWAETLLSRKIEGYRADMSPATHPIRADVPDVARAMANFDAITYEKGAAVLKQLSAYVGEDAFVAGLRAYFAKHAYGNTRLDDLMTEFAASSGQDLSAWTPAWLDRAGADTIRLSDGSVSVESPDAEAPRSHRIEIHSYRAAGAGLTRVGAVEVTTAGAETAVRLPGGDVHLLNGADLTFAAIRTDPGSQRVLNGRAAALPDPLSRALVVGTVWDRLLKAEIGPAAAHRTMLGILESEQSPGVVEVLFQLAVRVAEQFAGDDDSPELRSLVADVALARTHEPAFSTPALRVLAAHATTEEHFAAIEGPAAGDRDLGWRLLSRRAELGECDADAVDRLERSDPDPEAWVRALGVRAATPAAEAKESTWQAMLVDRVVPAGTPMLTVTRYFWRPGQTDLLRPFTARYLDAAKELNDGGLLTTGSLLRSAFPNVGADAGFVEAALRLADDDGTAPAVRQVLLVGCDTLSRVLRARAFAPAAEPPAGTRPD